MDYICQFLTARELTNVYIATNDDLYKEKASQLSGYPLLLLSEFTKEDGNVFIWKKVQIMYMHKNLYVFDDNANYLKIAANVVTNVYITDIPNFNIMRETLHTIFAEIFVGDVILDYGIANSFYVLPNKISVPINLSGFAIYGNNNIEKIKSLA
jgi:hypothetical protein